VVESRQGICVNALKVLWHPGPRESRRTAPRPDGGIIAKRETGGSSSRATTSSARSFLSRHSIAIFRSSLCQTSGPGKTLNMYGIKSFSWNTPPA
jgi:hypothetical protein